jgi:hypothetical protein
MQITMDFILNKRANGGRVVSNDSTDTTVRHDFLFGLDDSGIATSNDVHSLEFDDQLPATSPPPVAATAAIVVAASKVAGGGVDKNIVVRKIGTFEKSSKATSSIPSLSINSNATIHIHYYPEQSIFWSYVIVLISTIVQILIHGLQLSFGILLLSANVFVASSQVDLISFGNFSTFTNKCSPITPLKSHYGHKEFLSHSIIFMCHSRNFSLKV